MLQEWSKIGVQYVSVEAGELTREGVCRSGLNSLRVRDCGLDFPQRSASCMATPAGRASNERRGSAVGKSDADPREQAQISRARSYDLPPALTILGDDQPLCYWWNKGYKYDACSWYGREHLEHLEQRVL
eukprot:2675772-Amphidinium_carterae.1